MEDSFFLHLNSVSFLLLCSMVRFPSSLPTITRWPLKLESAWDSQWTHVGFYTGIQRSNRIITYFDDFSDFLLFIVFAVRVTFPFSIAFFTLSFVLGNWLHICNALISFLILSVGYLCIFNSSGNTLPLDMIIIFVLLRIIFFHSFILSSWSPQKKVFECGNFIAKYIQFKVKSKKVIFHSSGYYDFHHRYYYVLLLWCLMAIAFNIKLTLKWTRMILCPMQREIRWILILTIMRPLSLNRPVSKHSWKRTEATRQFNVNKIRRERTKRKTKKKCRKTKNYRIM